jgi:phospholipid transport system substrate-binding protein
MWSRRLILAAIVAGAAALGAPARGGAEEFGDAARKFIETLAQRAIADLTSKEVPRQERVRRFRALMDEYFAWRGIAQWVLGRYWPRATPRQQKEYLDLYQELMIITYVDRFTNYAGETLSVLNGEVVDGRDALVHTLLTRPHSSDPLKVEWRVRAKEGLFKIIDIMVEGVSMGQAQRSEFASAISQQGGDLDAFLKELRKRVRPDA